MENKKSMWDWITGDSLEKAEEPEKPANIKEFVLTKDRYTPLEVTMIIKEVFEIASRKKYEGVSIARHIRGRM